MTHTKEVVVLRSPTGRRYIAAEDIVSICGAAFRWYDFDTKFRPLDWSTPRDFKWDGKRMWIAEESLGRLADALTSAGANDGAILLRAWLAEHLAQVAQAKERAATLIDRKNSNWLQSWEERNDR